MAPRLKPATPPRSRRRERTAGVPPASSRGVSPRVGTGGETPPELAGEDACATPTATATTSAAPANPPPHVGGYIAGANPALDTLLASLITDRVLYFPIRHHSPAGARHLEHLLRERRPDTVLIEGPADFTPPIPLLLHPETQAPFAIYTSFAETPSPASTPAPSASVARALPPPRRAAYYPFCDYSPELVALRTGTALGAKLRFIDLDYPQQVRATQAAESAPGAPRVESLLSEQHLPRSRYLQALARRAGCRDHNDLWDHCFK